MERNLQRSARKRPLGADAEQSPLRERDVNTPRSLFFPSGERRRDLDEQDAENVSKRLRVDAPVFFSQGLAEAVAASEPAAKEALMGLATGHLVYYGGYYETNKFLRELAFERESRQRFGFQSTLAQNRHLMVSSGGKFEKNDDSDDDL